MKYLLITVQAVLVLGLLGSSSFAAERAMADRAAIDQHLAPFFKKHCVACHGETDPEGNFRVNSLAREPITSGNGQHWGKVLTRIASGEMPPKDEPRPTPGELAAVTKWLGQELANLSLAQRKDDGRVLLRRMNRREYEATLHDLLGIATPLQDLLPQDNPVHGFDTVSRGLETSATHLLRYQQAAEKAIQAALPTGPITSKVTRWTGREYLEGRQAVHRKGIDPFVRLDGDALVLHAKLYGDNSMQAPRPPMPGRYRVRAALRLVNTDGKAMPVLIGKRVDRFQMEKLMHIVDIVDVQPGETKMIEVETDIGYSQGNQFIYFEGVTLPFFGEMQKQRMGQPVGDDFAGPGLAIDWSELEGPLDVELGYQRMFGDLPQLPRMPQGKPLPKDWQKWHPNEFNTKPLVAHSENPHADAERLIRGFLLRAFRRPAPEPLAAHYVKLVRDQLDEGEAFDEALRAGYKAILCSPHFLTYIEQPGRLDDYAVAARLARFLWSSLPDDELLKLAQEGKLAQPAVLRAQTERMLQSPRAKRFAASFVDQWLDLGKFLDMKPDEIYVEYDDMLAWSMPLETREFFDEVLAKDLPTSSFANSDWTFLNSRLAQHYGVSGVDGLSLRKVAVRPEHHRGGVITHASVLKLTTNASYTSPIKRGAWILERIVGKPPSPPPPDVKAIEPDIRGATTIREQLDKHKNVAVCASCHVQIDPPGFALENYDVVGGWRDNYRVKQPPKDGKRVELTNYPGKMVWHAKPVEAHGETADGKAFQNIDDYRRLLSADRDQLTRNLAEKLIVYSTGAAVDFADRAAIEQIVADVRSRDHGFRSLVHAVVQSSIFLHK